MADFAPKKPLRPVASVSAPPTNGCAAFVTRGAGLNDRSSRPRTCPRLVRRCAAKAFAQRRSRRTYRQISEECGVAPSTLGRWLAREGLNRLAALEPAPPIVRYEHPNPGDMLHLDIKNWVVSTSQATGSRITASRTPVTRAGSTCMWRRMTTHGFPLPAFSLTKAAGAPAGLWWRHCASTARLASPSSDVLTDNGACYRLAVLPDCADAWVCAICAPSPIRRAPMARRERFIQTALREWAYAHSDESSDHRAQHLPLWLAEYNHRRPHASLGYKPPMSRIPALNNVWGLHTSRRGGATTAPSAMATKLASDHTGIGWPSKRQLISRIRRCRETPWPAYR